MKTLTVMSYNIKNSSDKNDYPWDSRKAALVALLRARQPDVLCMQEVLMDQMQYLRAMLPAYDFFGVGRDDGGTKGEFSPVFFRRSRFENAGGKTLWLSETPDLPSKGWDADHIRICTLLLLREKESGVTFCAGSLHLDHVGQTAQRKGAEVVRQHSAAIAENAQCFLAGDYNFQPGTAPYDVMCAPPFADARLAAPEHTTFGSFHGFGKRSIEESSPIDHVFYTPGPYRPTRGEVLAVAMNGLYPSDHHPLLVTFQAD